MSPETWKRVWEKSLARRNLERVARAVGKPLPGPRALPCVHEGNVLELCHTCGGRQAEGRHVRECEVHGRCTRLPNRAGLASCATCPDYRGQST